MVRRTSPFLSPFLLASALLAAGDRGDVGSRSIAQVAGPTTFTVVALNACWLFDGVGEGDFSTAPQSPEEAESHLRSVASYLTSVVAAFIAIAEIEDAAMLDRLNEKLGGGYHALFVQGTDEGTGQDVAALSRCPVEASGRSDACVRYPVPESRLRGPQGIGEVAKHFWAATRIGGRTISLIGVHLLAYPDELNRVTRREAQASIVRDLAKTFLNAGHEVIVLGDINDFDSEVLDAAGNEPRSCVDRLLKDVDPDLAGDELVSASARLDPSERYTYWYDRNRNGVDDGAEEHSQLDHIFVSSGLVPYLIDIRIDRAYEAGAVSDHWPVIATFEFPSE